MATVEAERFTFLRGQVNQAERKISDARMVISEQEKHVAFCRAWIKDLEASICPTCSGHGCLNVWYAQDECRIEKCDTCKGSGMRKAA